MSDIPPGYYLGPQGERLLEFRRKPNLGIVKIKHAGAGSSKLKAPRVKYRLLARDGSNCHYCERPMIPSISDEQPTALTMTVEHIVPRAHGGRNNLENLVLACYRCNNERGDGPSPCDCPRCETALAVARSLV